MVLSVPDRLKWRHGPGLPPFRTVQEQNGVVLVKTTGEHAELTGDDAIENINKNGDRKMHLYVREVIPSSDYCSYERKLELFNTLKNATDSLYTAEEKEAKGIE